MSFDYQKMYTYVKGYAMGSGFEETLKALACAREAHKDQLRKGGEPYIIHPLTMCCHAISLGLDDDDLLATILLHDVVEDCEIPVSELPVNSNIQYCVALLTFKCAPDQNKAVEKRIYFEQISSCKVAAVVKLIDRCHNVSSMAGVFTVTKIHDYIDETNAYIFPLLRTTKDNWPEVSNQLFALKYHITSVVDAVSIMASSLLTNDPE